MSSYEESISKALLFSLIVNLLTMFWFLFSKHDATIKSGEKILIDNAVYKCSKIQELDLK